MISVLQPKIDSAKSQIAALKNQLSTLAKADSEATRGIKALTSAIEKFSLAAPDELPVLRRTVLDLFNVGCDSGIQVNTAGGPTEVFDFEVKKSPDPLLNGQTCEIDLSAYWQTATPDGSSWELMTPLCCLVEDAPLMGQYYELTCAVTSYVEAVYENTTETKPTILEPVSINKVGDNAEAQDVFQLVNLTPSVAYMRKEDGQICCTYVGSNNKANLKRWGEFLTGTHTVGTKFELREAKRLTSWKWELKLWGLSFKQIEKLSGCDINKDPRKCFPDAPVRKPASVPSDLELADISIGDVIRSVTVRHWQYKVVEVNADGFYVCERLNTNPTIIQTLHPGSVELVRKSDAVDQASIELAQHLEAQAEDALNSIQPELPKPIKVDVNDAPQGIAIRPSFDGTAGEYEVWASLLVRVQGQLKPQQKLIGRLSEGARGIAASRPMTGITGIRQIFDNTQSAVTYLLTSSNYKLSDLQIPAALKQPALVGANITDIDDEF